MLNIVEADVLRERDRESTYYIAVKPMVLQKEDIL
jgi:hypothetical protein